VQPVCTNAHVMRPGAPSLTINGPKEIGLLVAPYSLSRWSRVCLSLGAKTEPCGVLFRSLILASCQHVYDTLQGFSLA
jgi:hypothetical protein